MLISLTTTTKIKIEKKTELIHLNGSIETV